MQHDKDNVARGNRHDNALCDNKQAGKFSYKTVNLTKQATSKKSENFYINQDVLYTYFVSIHTITLCR